MEVKKERCNPKCLKLKIFMLPELRYTAICLAGEGIQTITALPATNKQKPDASLLILVECVEPNSKDIG